MKITFDMDGTLNKMYQLPHWIEDIDNGIVDPYIKAKPAFNFTQLARLLNQLQKQGYTIEIITWLSKNGTDEYNTEVARVKRQWLQKHLPSVVWDDIHIVKYGYPKHTFCGDENDIIFDDNKKVRTNWTGKAYDEKNILEILKKILDNAKEM